MKLTDKQNNYCLNLVKGLSQREAYIQAGYSDKQALETIDVHAYHLANNAKVMTRLDELRKKAEAESIADGVEIQARLTQFIREDIVNRNGINRSSNIQAADSLAKMKGLYAPQEINHKGNVLLVLGRSYKEIEE